MQRQKVLEFQFGELEVPDTDREDPFMETTRSLSINGKIFGYCFKVRDSERNHYLNHVIHLFDKEAHNNLNLDRGNSYEMLLEILEFEEQAIWEELKDKLKDQELEN